jgi:hypothetical protein
MLGQSFLHLKVSFETLFIILKSKLSFFASRIGGNIDDTWRVFEDGQRGKGFELWTFIIYIVDRDLDNTSRRQLME